MISYRKSLRTTEMEHQLICINKLLRQWVDNDKGTRATYNEMLSIIVGEIK